MRAGGPLSGLRGSRQVHRRDDVRDHPQAEFELQLAGGELGLALLLEVGGASAYPVGVAV